MTRKITSGPIRDKERTKKKLTDSVGKILKKQGFAGLNARQIAMKAGVHRKLIYEYFGGMEGLVAQYLSSRDYWRVSLEHREAIIEQSRKDFGKQMAYTLLENQFDSLMKSEEMRNIIHWGISESLKPLQELNKEREQLGEEIFTKITDDYFQDKGKNMRAIEGILIGGIYYLTLHAKMNDAAMCGIDINTPEGETEIKKALKQIIDWAYS
ncbi:TetR/AcrR family transcriptional regulator [Chryseobacterium viscerum]|uniref:TetR/AcrR family transcriptional regulator n=1 Tax=Chryseobacterium viscerum TaxID=1037377 RepID=A0A316WRY5_9FLAO|nr:TetR/AcrR family transcriptional regulator [Chryseobacterium viscerum]PWN64181.1 TetR/AcrR family transcriptional regulator [Chryseobacterium viscerum]